MNTQDIVNYVETETNPRIHELFYELRDLPNQQPTRKVFGFVPFNRDEQITIWTQIAKSKAEKIQQEQNSPTIKSATSFWSSMDVDEAVTLYVASYKKDKSLGLFTTKIVESATGINGEYLKKVMKEKGKEYIDLSVALFLVSLFYTFERPDLANK